MMKRRRHASQSTGSRIQRGIAAVEFALVIPIVLLFLLGGIEWGWYYVVSQITMNSATEGARTATTFAGACGSPGAGRAQSEGVSAANRILNIISYQAYGKIDVACTTNPENPTWQVDVTVDFPRLVGFPLVPMPKSTTAGNTVSRFTAVQRGTP